MPFKGKPVIGLAGGIGAGKSTVARILRELGCAVVNSDDLAREALRDPDIKRELVKWWGQNVLDATGEIDRSTVAHVVFADPAERKRLEALTHPWIEERRREHFAEAERSTCAYVIDAPLLFEAGVDQECDAVIFVDAPRKLRLERLMRDRGWSEEELNRRESSQLSLDEKRSRADYVVENTGDLAALAEGVGKVLKTICAA
jgi:dephospho-CoA kinase